MYSGQTYENKSGEWIDILEEHFKDRGKAFLVFNADHILKHISDYASDLLEIPANQIGVMNFSDLFPRVVSKPDMLADSNFLLQKTRDYTYMKPSGKQVDIRLNLDQKPGMNGYLVWIELRLRDVTGLFKKVSPLKSYSHMKHIFDSFKMGFLVLDINGTVIDLNDHFKHIFRLPGEWIGQNLFTYPPLQQNKLSDFIHRTINGRKQHSEKTFRIKYSSQAESINIIISGVQIFDLAGNLSGALFSCKQE